nr:hypothetical protein [uncultured Dyadobacter sp.]
MALLLVATAYVAILFFLIVKLLKTLFFSQNRVIRTGISIVTAAFAAFLFWSLFDFLRNENGKSFTVGWLGLAYLAVISFTLFAFICWALSLVDERL